MAELALGERIATLCRLDESWVGRIERKEGLAAVALRALSAIIIGGGAYGFVFGWWRGELQAVYGAIKVPLLFMLVAVFASASSAMLGTLLGSRLSFRQTVVCLLTSFAITSILLGALAPIAFFAVAHAPGPGPGSLGVARTILFNHVCVVGIAGWIGIIKLGALLERLVPRPAIARRVLASWMLLVGASGAELSWLLRPFLGKPHLPQSFFRQGALQGSFFEEVGTILNDALGPAGTFVWLALALLMLFAWSRSATNFAKVRIVEGGIELDLGRASVFVGFEELVSVRVFGSELHVQRMDARSLAKETYVVKLDDANAAQTMAAELERLRASAAQGPFRTVLNRGQVR